MGKYSSFHDLPENSFWPTPEKATRFLLPHLRHGQRFWEPCAGNGSLAGHLRGMGMECVGMSDLFPRGTGIAQKCATKLGPMPDDVIFITNTPWPGRDVSKESVIEMIKSLAENAPVWAIFKANIASNKYFAKFPNCACIAPAGRPSWVGNGTAGKEDSAWFLFDPKHTGPAEHHVRQEYKDPEADFDARDLAILEAHRQGTPVSEIAQQIGCYSGTVRAVIENAGVV